MGPKGGGKKDVRTRKVCREVASEKGEGSYKKGACWKASGGGKR